MPGDSLADLFPGLPRDVLLEFEEPSHDSGAPLNVGGETAEVTDDDVENYLRSIGSLRAPLKPAVEGQQLPTTPEFARNGRQAPPANAAIVEEPDYGDGGTGARFPHRLLAVLPRRLPPMRMTGTTSPRRPDTSPPTFPPRPAHPLPPRPTLPNRLYRLCGTRTLSFAN